MPSFDETPPEQDALEQMQDQLRAGGTLTSVAPQLRPCLDRVQAYTEPLLEAGYPVDVQLRRGADGRYHGAITAQRPPLATALPRAPLA